MASMILKTFRGESMAQALAEVKRTLGKDAVIVHTRAIRVGSVMGLGGKPVFEITASDGGAVAGRPRSAAAPLARAKRPDAESTQHTADTPAIRELHSHNIDHNVDHKVDHKVDHHDRHDRRDLHDLSALGDATVRELKPARPSPTGPSTTGTNRAALDRLVTPLDPRHEITAANPDVAQVESLRAEIAGVRRLVVQLLEASRAMAFTPAPIAAPSDDGLQRVNALHAASVARAAAAAPVEQSAPPAQYVRPTLSLTQPPIESRPARSDLRSLWAARLNELEIPGPIASELLDGAMAAGPARDDEAVRAALVRALAAWIEAHGEARRRPRAASGPRLVALVGSTGVGKTTTIAKLAAAARIRDGKRVGLITCDTFRIGAVDQLRTYAGIMNIAVRVVAAPEEWRTSLNAFADRDLVLIDTAGRSHRDGARLGELAELLDAAPIDETHLVLSATSSAPAMRAAAERFAALRPTGLIISKVDEAPRLGHVLDVLARARLRPEYLTTGQEVPDHIEAASAERVAREILAGEIGG